MSRMLRAAAVLLIVSLCAPLTGGIAARDSDVPKGVPTGSVVGEITSHQDGRTMSVLIDGSKRTIVLLGVDAPYLDEGEFGECYASEAKLQLRRLAPVGELVYLESDPSVNKDDEGRLVRYVWTVRNDKALHINFRLIRDGFADFDDDALGNESPYAEEFDKAIDSAKDNDRGLWEECGRAHKKATPPPTPTPTADEVRAGYAPLADVRELVLRPGGLYGQKLVLYGQVLTLQVAPSGRAFTIGDSDPQQFQVYMQIYVLTPDGAEEAIVVGYNGDTAGIFEGTYVVVYGEPFDVDSGINGFGGVIYQPAVDAALIEIQ